MNIPFKLNGSKIVLDVRPEESLMTTLRKNNITSVKCGCSKGICGSCCVLFNDSPIPSCKLPTALIRDADIVTYEYFEKSKEFAIIQKGFDYAGIKLCGYCNTGKFFTAYQILKMNKVLSRKEITSYVKNLSPCCTDLLTLVNGIIWALEINKNGEEIAHKKYLASKKIRN